MNVILILKLILIILEQNMKSNHFQENFEDSEANLQEQVVQYDMAKGAPGQEGQPIQLIKVKHNGEIQLNENALQIINSCQLPVGFVCLVGKYRTGKSFLLNKLLFLQGKGFRVDSSTSACTDGIWMWSKPVYNQRFGNFLFFLDTEGLDSLNKDSEHDAKIFTLACLLSSYLIFNSVGAIDQRSIAELGLVTALSQRVITDQNLNSRQNDQNLFKFMPKFLWLLRDFTLELQDERRKRITPNQYLQNCLHDQKSRVNEPNIKIKKSVVNYFKDRQCMVLVRPAKQQSDLQRLNGLPEYSLRKQFIQGMNSLRQKIVKNALAKVYGGQNLDGKSMACMIEHYINTINDGALPNIKTAWQHVADEEAVMAYNQAIDKYQEIYEEEFQQDQPKGQQIHSILNRLRDESINQFYKSITQPNSTYESKLKGFVDEKNQEIITVNNQLNDCRNIEILKDNSKKLMKDIEENKYTNKKELLIKDIDNVSKMYNQKAKGQNKGDIIAEFLIALNPIILNIDQENSRNQAQTDQAKKKYEDKIKQLQMQLLQSQNQNQQPKTGKIPGKQLPKQSAVRPPKQRKGCCGGQCMIM